MQDSAVVGHHSVGQLAGQVRPKLPTLTAVMEEAEGEELASMNSSRERRSRLHSTSPLELLNEEIKRRTNVAGIVPNEPDIR